jgi:hypothetical protein
MYSYGRKSGRRRVGIGAAAVAGVTLLAFTIVPVVGGATSVGAAPRAIAPFQLVWSQSVNGQNGNPNDGGLPIAVSSPNLADLQGAPAVVVGDRAGNVLAYNLANGSIVPGWPYSDGTIPIDASPSVSPDGSTVYVGLGNAVNPNAGSYLALNQYGRPLWDVVANNPASDLAAPASGVNASMSLGLLQGQTAVTAGNLGQAQYALNAGTGAALPGWDPWFSGDSEISTPAIADLYGTGQNEVIEGIGTLAGNLFGTQYAQGGHLRVISQTGNLGQQYPNGGLDCQLSTDEAINSSPAVGHFLGGNAEGIVTGTSDYFGSLGQPGFYTDTVVAMAPTNGGNCAQAWVAPLDGNTSPGPTLADVLGNGTLQVVEGTASNNNLSGSVYVLNGANGSVIWSRPLLAGDIGSVATVDPDRQGYQDLLVPTISGVEVLDGRTGNLITTLGTGAGFQNTPLVTNDPNGTIGITIAGYDYATDHGLVEHYEISSPGHADVRQSGAWPQFHHDPQLTGNASGDTQLVPIPPGVGMAATNDGKGYWIVASDGGLFAYGDAGFHGSPAGTRLNEPIVGMAATPDSKGYWLVASDGGIFAYGDAAFWGSAGNIRLNRPIVGMATTHDGRGYWLVASDGGIFAYGDAGFWGSAGNIRLNQPIVGMASTSDGRGYWLVAADGGIFAYGDAGFWGSAGNIRLNQPIVGMASTPDGRGYWLVAADGGIFAYGDARFWGSAGNLRLNRPIVGMAAAPGNLGYWLVAADGGIFAYGDAGYYGSRGGTST